MFNPAKALTRLQLPFAFESELGKHAGLNGSMVPSPRVGGIANTTHTVEALVHEHLVADVEGTALFVLGCARRFKVLAAANGLLPVATAVYLMLSLGVCGRGMDVDGETRLTRPDPKAWKIRNSPEDASCAQPRVCRCWTRPFQRQSLALCSGAPSQRQCHPRSQPVPC